jgi:hypothetical protein
MGDDSTDILVMLHAARVELGRRLSDAWKRRDQPEIDAAQRQITVACTMARAVAGPHRRVVAE